MSTLEFLAAVIDSLVWPALVAWLVYGFRAPILALLGRMSSIKFKDLEAEFEKSLDKIQVFPKLSEPSATVDKVDCESVTIMELAEMSPRGAVMEAWIKIEKATRAYLESIGIESRYSYQGLHRLPTENLRPIRSILSPYQELRLLRNKAAHALEFDISSETAKDYVTVASSVEQIIREAIR